MPDPTSIVFTLAPPPPGFSGTLADVFALIQNTLTGTIAQDSTLLGQGSVLPTSNLGPFIYTGVNPPQLYTWSTVTSSYVPAAMPPGTIIQVPVIGQDIKLCSGTLAQINALQNPLGWFIADGGTYNGTVTPDMRNRFIVGQGSDYAQDSTGGASTLANHTHALPAATDAHTLTSGEMPAHTHGFDNSVTYNPGTGGGSGNNSWNQNGFGAATPLAITSAGGGGSHTHGITGPSGNQNTTLSIINPYYALAILIFCGVP